MPWQTVARSGELSARVLRHGIWGVPHAGGALRLRFPAVTLGARLDGFHGVPDWGVALATARKDAGAPIRLRVSIPTASLQGEWTNPIEAGWRDVSVDTSAVAGQQHDVVIEVDGGAGDVDQRFLFDFWVP